MRTALVFALLASAGSAAVFVADDRQPPAPPQPSEVDEGLPQKRSVRKVVKPPQTAAEKKPVDDEKPSDVLKELLDANKANDQVDRALEQLSFADFSETPLHAALMFLSTQHKVRIYVDQAGLANAMVDRDSPITFQMAGIRLSLILDLMLEPMNLDYVVRENVLFISSKENIERMRETVVVRIGDILPPGAPADEVGAVADRLQQLITENVDRDGWIPNGGQNTIQFVEDAKSFVVTSNGRTQRKVSKLLSDLRAAKLANGMPVNGNANERIAAR